VVKADLLLSRFINVTLYITCRCEDAGRMLISLIIQVNTAITVVQKLQYPEDSSNADLDFLLKGLMTDLMKEHLKRYILYIYT